MMDQKSQDQIALQEDLNVALVTGCWNLCAAIANTAIEAGMPRTQVAAALKTLAQQNDKSMDVVAGGLVNEGIWRLFDIHD
jgi:hypothetical protein